MSSVDPQALSTRISEIRQALDNRRLEDDSAKLRLFLDDKDIEAVAAAISGGTEAAQSLLMATANNLVWASTWSHANRVSNKPRGRPADYHLFAVVSACCNFWETSEGRSLKFSRPKGGGVAYGPLIRFIGLVHGVLIGDAHPAKPNTIAGQINQIKRGKTDAFDALRGL